MMTMKKNFRLTLCSIVGVSCLIFVCLFCPSDIFAFKPKTHIYAAIQAIQLILQGQDKIIIDGVSYDADPEVCDAIRTVPAAYIAGVIGPDGFPDLLFGQQLIHPDLRCDYSSNLNGDECDRNANTKTWSYEWLRHVFESAYNETGLEKKQALAFAYGYLTHAAGDMWAHTLVNQLSEGSWPDNLSDPIVIRHMTVEGIIAQHTPDIQADLGIYDDVYDSNPGDWRDGLDTPTSFIYDTFINDSWSLKHAEGSLVKMFVDLRGALIRERDSITDVGWSTARRALIPSPFDLNPLRGGNLDPLREAIAWKFLDCWIQEIDEGLQVWPHVSSQVASQVPPIPRSPPCNGSTDRFSPPQ